MVARSVMNHIDVADIKRDLQGKYAPSSHYPHSNVSRYMPSYVSGDS